MTYHNAIKFLNASPKILAEATAGNRMRQILKQLNEPQKNLVYVRMTGTEGKSVCAQMLEAMFDADYSVGLLTLTDKLSARDCIRICRKPISPTEFSAAVGTVYDLLKQNQKKAEPDPQSPTQLTYCEILLCAAVLIFRKHGCQLCMVESEAAPNDPSRVLPVPLAAVICGEFPCDRPQEWQILRSYLVHGIREIVCAPQTQEAYRLLSQICATINCRLTIPAKARLELQKTSLRGSEFLYRQTAYRICLCGSFQVTNAALALEAADMLTRHGFPLAEPRFAEGLQRVRVPSVFEILSVSPTVIADRAHTEEAMKVVGQALWELRSSLGSRVSLCLPEGASVSRWTSILQNARLTVAEAICVVPASAADRVAASGNAPAAYVSVAEAMAHMLRSDAEPSVWLLVGEEAWLNPLRDALRKQLEA